MKHKIIILSVLCLILFSSCAQAPLVSPTLSLPQPSSSLPPEYTDTPDPGDSGEAAETPVAPDIPYIRGETPEDQEIALEYEISPPPDEFLPVMYKLSDKEYSRLRDQENFLYVDDFLIFNGYDTEEKNYKIVIQNGYGEQQTVFVCSRPIYGLQFFDRDKLIVELIEYVDFEQADSGYYILDLSRKVLLRHYDGAFTSSMIYSHCWYDGKFIISKLDLTAETHYYINNLYWRENGDDLLLVEGVYGSGPRFDSGKMYYIAAQDNTLYSFDLNTFAKTAVYTFVGSKPNQYSYVVNRDKVFLYDNRELIICDMNTHKETAVEMDPIWNIRRSSDGGVYILTEGHELWQVSADGEKRKLLLNFKAPVFVVLDKTIYISGSGSVGYIHKIDLNANPIILESTMVP